MFTLISLINVEPTLTNFEKFHPPQKKIPPPRLLISLLKCLILLQNLMTIFLTIILSYKTLFYHKNWCLLPPPHLVIFHFWHPSTFIPGSTFIREMRVHLLAVFRTVKCVHWENTVRRICEYCVFHITNAEKVFQITSRRRVIWKAFFGMSDVENSIITFPTSQYSHCWKIQPGN